MVNIMDYGAVAVQCTDGEVWEVMTQCVCVCVCGRAVTSIC